MDPVPPSITLTTEEGGEHELVKKTVKFQCGLLREEETFIGEDIVEQLCRETLLEFVCDMLNVKVCHRGGRKYLFGVYE